VAVSRFSTTLAGDGGGVRFKVYEPQPLAAVKRWRWELEGDSEDELLARSPWLASREDCFGMYNRICNAFEKGQVEIVEVPTSRRLGASGAESV
jgi:hypothetical protein